MYAQMELLLDKKRIIQLFLTSGDRDDTPRDRMERIDRMARPTYNLYPGRSEADWFRYRRWKY